MTLIFVYNATAGIAAGMMGSVHKLLRPATYACGLCAITHGVLRMDPKWKAWLKSQQFATVFHHRPDFRAAYPTIQIDLPAILVDCGAGPEVLVDAADFADIDDVDTLIATIERRL